MATGLRLCKVGTVCVQIQILNDSGVAEVESWKGFENGGASGAERSSMRSI